MTIWACAVIATVGFGFAIIAGRGAWALLAVAVLIYGAVPALRTKLRRTRVPSRDARRSRHVRLGQLLVRSYGWITPGQLRQALAKQKGTRQLLGAILLEMGVLTAMQLETVLAHQRRLDVGGLVTTPECDGQVDRPEALQPAR